jgi:hypothetical protein
MQPEAIQLWLEAKFRDVRPHGVVPSFTYVRKRTPQRIKRLSEKLTLEDLAKIRYAWFLEPTACVADPRSLWTLGEDGGLYEKAFGLGGRLLQAWTDQDFEETLGAVVFFLNIEARLTALRKKDRALSFIRRLRYFILSIGPIYLRHHSVGVSALINSKIDFENAFSMYWKEAVREINSLYRFYVEQQRGTLFALARSETQWSALRDSFQRALDMEMA